MNTLSSQQIFQQPHQTLQSFEFNYLDIDQYFTPHSSTNCPESKEDLFEAAQRKMSNLLEEGLEIIPFQPIYRREENDQSNLFQEHPEESIPQKNEKLAPSVITKNVCFNICQKTIKVIQKETYGNKLSQICQEHAFSKDTFIRQIVKVKKDFTGPKALQKYISETGQTNQIFKSFMRWFLKQKYLRHCLSGDMLNKEAYIKFKNEVMLVILD